MILPDIHREVQQDRSPLELAVIQGLDGAVSVIFVFKLDEGEAFGLAGGLMDGNLDIFDRSERLE